MDPVFEFIFFIKRGLLCLFSFVIMSFYATLPSDSSMSYFPENKISHFVTRLSAPLDLKGEWEVGLTELIYPHIWSNVLEKCNEYEYDAGTGVIRKAKIPAGYYETPAEIIKWIQYQNFKDDNIAFTYNKHNRKVKISLKPTCKVKLLPGLAECLGFDPCELINDDYPSRNSPYKVFESPRVADPNEDYKLLYIYSDIVENQILGDVVAPLLRVIPVKGKDGDMIHEVFDRPHYIPLSRKSFQTIETVIRTHTGKLVSFDRGKLIVKLHFRQKYLS